MLLMLVMVMMVMELDVELDSDEDTNVQPRNTRSSDFSGQRTQTKSTAMPVHASPTEISGRSFFDPLVSPDPYRQRS